MVDEAEYERHWPKLTQEWGKALIEGWHKELEADPLPSHARQVELNKNIAYLGRLLERIPNA